MNGAYTLIQDWTTAASLNSGYNVINKILVTYNNITHDFDVSFNNVWTYTFNDSDFSDGESGFMAGVGASENLPGTPVDIRFNMQQPVLAP